jgi:hypothetical protein
VNTGRGDRAGDVLDTAGGYVVTGGTLAANIGARGAEDAWIIRLDAEGRMISQHAYGSGGHDAILRLAPAADGGYVALAESGSSDGADGRPVLLKFNATSEVPQWQRMYVASARQFPADVRPTSDGGYIIAGTTDGCLGGARRCAAVMKIDAVGDVEWARSFSSSNSTQVVTAASIVEAMDGGYVVVGQILGSPGGSKPHLLLLFGLDAAGNHSWSASYPTEFLGLSTVGQIERVADGGYIVVSENGGWTWLLKIRVDGSLSWQMGYGRGLIAEIGARVVPATDGGYVVAGRTRGASDFDGFPRSDVWIAKIGSDGQLLRQRAFDARGFSEKAVGLRATRDGGFIFVGADPFPSPRGLLVVKTDVDLEVPDGCGTETDGNSLALTAVRLDQSLRQGTLTVTATSIGMTIVPTYGRNHLCEAGYYGPPPEIHSVSTQLFRDKVQCDVTETLVAQICTLGVPGVVPTAPIVLDSTYDMLVVAADVTDRDSTTEHNDIVEVRADLAPFADLFVAYRIPLLDDGSSTVETQLQRSDLWGGKDCDYDPIIGLCECGLARYPTYSGDSSSDDGRYTREMGLFSNATPSETVDCFLEARSRTPLVGLDDGAPAEVRLRAVDRQGNVTTWPDTFELTTGAGSLACSGDECGCCLILNPYFFLEFCRGKPGMTSPDIPQGLCNIF